MPFINYSEKKIEDKFVSVPLLRRNPGLQSYHCPFCNTLIAHGNIGKFTMACSHCYQFIRAEAEELLHIRPS